MSRLVEEVRRQGGVLATESAAREAIKGVTAAIANLAAGNERVTIQGFGTFQKKFRAGRVGRNPQTGAPIDIAAREDLVFKASR